MRHIVFQEAEKYSVAVLARTSTFNKQELLNNYVTPLVTGGVPLEEVIAFTLEYNEAGKAPSAFIKEYLGKLLPILEELKVKYLYITDAAYFKTLTGQTKAEPHFGYVLPCKIKGYEHMKVVLGINYLQLIYNPDLQAKLTLSLNTLVSHVAGTYKALGSGIIHSAQYPQGVQEIADALESLHQYPSLAADIEAFSLRFNEAGIGTIAFAWDEHNGIAFPCDYQRAVFDDGRMNPDCPEESAASHHGFKKPDPVVRALIRKFLETYKGTITWHNATYDVKVLIYTLWMKDLLDTEGLLAGLDVMTRSFHDTKIIAYLASNSTAGNILGLKALAHEFAGNWAVEEIKDIRKIPLDKLLQYNLVDGLSTNFVWGKYYPIMVNDQQEDLYRGLMLDSLKLIIQIELTGMPMSASKVQEVKAKITAIADGHLGAIHGSAVIKMLSLLVQESAWKKDYEDRKAKAKNPGKILPKKIEAFADVGFNPNSGPQLQRLLYELMGLPIIDLTETKQPATSADTLEKLINHTQEPAYKELISALIGYGKASKILTTFIPAFESAIEKGTGDTVWLHGSFNLGGTVSGRLSSNSPNLQNLPAGSIYGKLIKECFVGPGGSLFCGADFNALEDRINALLTKDPNKLKVFTDGYDSHCLRAFYFFPDRLPGITEDVESINSIKALFPQVRQDAKSPAFAIQYAGTWRTLVKNLGFAEALAKQIESNFHKMYSVSGQWVKAEITKAAAQGYAETAFGLRIRTPLLAQTYLGQSDTPQAAEAEARTLGNAISGQAFGLLNNRAAVEFMQKVWASKYRLDIKPVALIHDAAYYVIKDDIEVIEWANREMTKSMQWQELPEIQHPTVKLGAEMDIYWPSWAKATTLPNDADRETIINICKATREKVSAVA